MVNGIRRMAKEFVIGGIQTIDTFPMRHDRVPVIGTQTHSKRLSCHVFVSIANGRAFFERYIVCGDRVILQPVHIFKRVVVRIGVDVASFVDIDGVV